VVEEIQIVFRDLPVGIDRHGWILAGCAVDLDHLRLSVRAFDCFGQPHLAESIAQLRFPPEISLGTILVRIPGIQDRRTVSFVPGWRTSTWSISFRARRAPASTGTSNSTRRIAPFQSGRHAS
jgi:hypothetical protein